VGSDAGPPLHEPTEHRAAGAPRAEPGQSGQLASGELEVEGGRRRPREGREAARARGEPARGREVVAGADLRPVRYVGHVAYPVEEADHSLPRPAGRNLSVQL